MHHAGQSVVDEARQLAAEPAALSMPKKKRKASDMSAQAASPTVHAEAPQQQLAGHTQCVAGVAWPETQTVISGSWDHSVSDIMSLNLFMKRHLRL